MITGDHKTTAVAIAKEIGIFQRGDLALTGAELDQLSEAEVSRTIRSRSPSTLVFRQKIKTESSVLGKKKRKDFCYDW